eukprot:2769479-Prymnesium_polylepis.3
MWFPPKGGDVTDPPWGDLIRMRGIFRSWGGCLDTLIITYRGGEKGPQGSGGQLYRGSQRAAVTLPYGYPPAAPRATARRCNMCDRRPRRACVR